MLYVIEIPGTEDSMPKWVRGLNCSCTGSPSPVITKMKRNAMRFNTVADALIAAPGGTNWFIREDY